MAGRACGGERRPFRLLSGGFVCGFDCRGGRSGDFDTGDDGIVVGLELGQSCGGLGFDFVQVLLSEADTLGDMLLGLGQVLQVGGQILNVDGVVGAEGGLGEADAVGGHALLGGRGDGKQDFIGVVGFLAGLGQLQGLRCLGLEGFQLGHGQGGSDGESGFVDADGRHNVVLSLACSQCKNICKVRDARLLRLGD